MSDIIKVRSTIDGILSENDHPHDAAIKATQDLADLTLKKHALLLDLRKALIMQKWQPDAFKHGPCRLSFVGATGASLTTWHAELHLGNGETRTFPIGEVPEELLSDDIRQGLTKKGSSYFKRLPTRMAENASNDTRKISPGGIAWIHYDMIEELLAGRKPEAIVQNKARDHIPDAMNHVKDAVSKYGAMDKKALIEERRKLFLQLPPEGQNMVLNWAFEHVYEMRGKG